MEELGVSIFQPNKAVTKIAVFTNSTYSSDHSPKLLTFFGDTLRIPESNPEKHLKLLVKNTAVATANPKLVSLSPKHGANWLKRETNYW